MPSQLPAEAQRVGEALVTPPDVETRESGTAMLADVPVPPRRRGRSSRVSSREERVAGYAFVSPFFIMFGIFGLFPIVFTLWVSLHDWSLLGGKEGWAGMANYSALLHDDNFWNALVNTLGIFVLATVPQMLFALGLAQLLNERLRARTFGGWACCFRTSPRWPRWASSSRCSSPATSGWSTGCSASWGWSRSPGRTTGGRRGWRSR